MKIKVHNEFTDIIIDEWKDIEQNSNISIFQTYEWCYYWYKNLGEKKKFEISIVSIKTEGSKSIALFPFIIKKKYNIKILEFMAENVSDYQMPLIVKDYNNYLSLGDIFNKLQNYFKNFDVIILSRLADNFNNNNIYYSRELNVSFNNFAYNINYLKIDNINKIVPKKIRLDTSRQFKRLNKIGTLKFKKILSQKENKNIINKLIIQKKRRAIDQGQNYLFKSDDILKFYKNIYKNSFNTIEIELKTLNLNDETIAIVLGASYKNVYYYLIPTFNYEFHKYSPGKILLEQLIENYSSKNINIFDFTIGNEEYKKKYSNSNYELFDYVKSFSLSGFIIVNFIIFLKKMKSVKFIRNSAKIFLKYYNQVI